MISLATIGFITTGILFMIFAFVFNAYVSRKIDSLKMFPYAFFSLALAFILWGIAAFNGDTNMLATSVIIGNGLILLGSIFLLGILFEKIQINKIVGFSIGFVLAVLFLLWRVNYFPPHPYIQDAILNFNTEFPVAIILSLIIIFVWLSSAVITANKIVNYFHIKNLEFLYSSVFIMATVSALMFIASRTQLTIVLSFIGIMLCFVMLLVSILQLKVSK